MLLPLAGIAVCLAMNLAPTTATAKSTSTNADARTGESNWMRRHVPLRGQWELGAFTGVTIIGGRHDYYNPATAPQVPLGRAAPLVGLRAGYYPLSLLGVEAEGWGLWTRVPSRLEEPAFVYALRAQGVLQLPLYRLVPFVVGGYGITGVRSPRSAVGNDVDPAGHYGAGLKLMADRRFAVRLEGRHMMTPARARRLQVANHFSIMLGLSIRLGPEPSATRSDRDHAVVPTETNADTDRDGVRDSSDACPTLAGTFPHGCPAADFDDDGVPDSVDACPTDPATGDGCPERDTDRDGRPDSEDRCPWEAGDDRGCLPSDFDADGVPDREDQCPSLRGDPGTGCPSPAEPAPTP